MYHKRHVVQVSPITSSFVCTDHAVHRRQVACRIAIALLQLPARSALFSMDRGDPETPIKIMHVFVYGMALLSSCIAAIAIQTAPVHPHDNRKNE